MKKSLMETFQFTLMMTLVFGVILIFDIVLSILLTLPFSIYLSDWSLWITVFDYILKVQKIIGVIYFLYSVLTKYTKLGEILYKRRLKKQSEKLLELWDLMKKGDE